ncbi:unnamed protein product [Didymodactylos carnosus]|uniref:Uncharacterized protein n=1 Tax=Didymodactylos carnosus TaxID=1234261 RepID=A0A814WIZ7_9BILA|nr:unnamed protein product [Didymodactylos carnosus]CAF3968980.1 unnamed protein product [Didymodactylos carnosus]
MTNIFARMDTIIQCGKHEFYKVNPNDVGTLNKLSFKNAADKPINMFYYRKPWERVKPTLNMYNMQYPNCKQGIYSFRSKFVPATPPLTEQRISSTVKIRNAPNDNVVQAEKSVVYSYDNKNRSFSPEYLALNSAPAMRNLSHTQTSQRHVGVQCTRLLPNNHHDNGLRLEDMSTRQQTFVIQPESYRFVVHANPQLVCTYETLDVVPERTMSSPKCPVLKEQRNIYPRSPRLVTLDPTDELDYTKCEEKRAVCFRKPKYHQSPCTLLPSKLKMVYVKYDALI